MVKRDRHWIEHTVYRALRDSDPDTGNEYSEWPEARVSEKGRLEAEIGTRKFKVTERVSPNGHLFWKEIEKTPRKIQPRTKA